MNLCSLKLPFFFEFKVRTLEKLRLSAWRKMKDSPSIPESSVPSVTKGVKFAVSLLILIQNDNSLISVWHPVSIDWSQLEFHNLCKISDHFIFVSSWCIIDIPETFSLSVESP